MLRRHLYSLASVTLLGLCPAITPVALADDPLASARSSLTFAASFDGQADADFALGDRRIYHASSTERKDPKPGLPAGEIEVARGQGRHGGDALRFVKRSNGVVFFKAADNVAYRERDWSGTASFWLSLDPQADLGDWYCDPLQITEKAWNDGAIWVDFDKDKTPKEFRLGAFADLKVWNPNNRDFEKLPLAERPTVAVARPPFRRGAWTHVAITFERFNSGKADGVARLYLDGRPQGAVSGWNQRFTWDPAKAAIQVGISYVGLYDDLAIFNRALGEAEIQAVHAHQGRLGPAK